MSSVPIPRASEVVKALVQYITGSGYSEAQMKKLGLTKTPWKGTPGRPLLSRRVDPASALFVLIQLFFLGEEVSCASVEAVVPNSIVDGMLTTGMILREAECFVPACMLVHFGDYLIACDSVRRARAGMMSDLVLGVNRPTQVLANCTIPLRKAESILDLGTGCGTLAFGVAGSATRVVGTDINERALEFAQFNAALNGIHNFEVRAGDRFEPVIGETFDLVISNPPFFLTPSSKLLFTDNPFTLDSFVESLARQAPATLKDGGYFQMLCEWVQLEGELWQDRVKGWFENSGCDVLVLTDYEISPADYIQQRAGESAALYGDPDPDSLIEHIRYFEEQRVERIFGGLITIRRRSIGPDGKPPYANWFVAEETGGRPSTPIGQQILERFATEDILRSQSDSSMLSLKPCIAKDVVLVRESFQENRTWKARVIFLERRSGLVRRLAFNSEIAELVADWDGSQELDFLITVFARKKGLPKKQVTQDFLNLTRKLSSLNLISFGPHVAGANSN